MAKKKTNYNPLAKLNAEWHLEYLRSDTTFIKLIDSSSVTMTLNTNTQKVNGKNICNTFFGSVNFSTDTISFGTIGSTRMLCEGMELENIIFKMMKEVHRWKVELNRLTLSSADQKLEFLRYK
jgi:heat shock protein HslJ